MEGKSPRAKHLDSARCRDTSEQLVEWLEGYLGQVRYEVLLLVASSNLEQHVDDLSSIVKTEGNQTTPDPPYATLGNSWVSFLTYSAAS